MKATFDVQVPSAETFSSWFFFFFPTEAEIRFLSAGGQIQSLIPDRQVLSALHSTISQPLFCETRSHMAQAVLELLLILLSLPQMLRL